jgi:hypothetical protein
MGACPSPQLFAACHVLPRRPAPRHPPCALTSLGHSSSTKIQQNVASPLSPRRSSPSLSALSDNPYCQIAATEVAYIRRDSRRDNRMKPRCRWIGWCDDELFSDGTLERVVLLACSRKEVIQPQVPLRLPCYDFAPVTELAFGRSLPCGLGHGLRALPAPMA